MDQHLAHVDIDHIRRAIHHHPRWQSIQRNAELTFKKVMEQEELIKESYHKVYLHTKRMIVKKKSVSTIAARRINKGTVDEDQQVDYINLETN